MQKDAEGNQKTEERRQPALARRRRSPRLVIPLHHFV
jgi:hypothetical protein